MVALNPAYAPAKSTSRTENRVGDFFVARGDRVGIERPASRIVIGEKYDAAVTMASGHSKFANGAVTAAMVSAFGEIGSGNGSGRALTADEQKALQASADAYNTDGAGFASLGVAYDSAAFAKAGFSASATTVDGLTIVAFRGTNPSSWANWKSNFLQGLGFSSPQHNMAVSLGQSVFDATGGNVLFTGHSLGGGLASAASYATGANAVTFNAAGLSSRYRNGTPGNITAHYIRGDILSTAQDFSPLRNAAGNRVSHGANNWYNGPVNRHGLGHF